MPRCKIHRDKFTQKYMGQKHCLKDDECQSAESLLIKNRYKKHVEKEGKKETKERREKLLNHSDYIQLLQKVFNTYIRKRDEGNGCITCGTHAKVVYAAGHFHPTTYSYLRFNEDNVHLQCNEHCNRQKRGNLSEYRPALINKIGIERVEKLDNDRHKKLDLSISEIKELIEYYKQKIKDLK